jgi:hypothetical protein
MTHRASLSSLWGEVFKNQLDGKGLKGGWEWMG